MASIISYLQELFGRQDSRVLMVRIPLSAPLSLSSYLFQLGLDGSGRTTLLYSLVLGNVVTTIHTVGSFDRSSPPSYILMGSS